MARGLTPDERRLWARVHATLDVKKPLAPEPAAEPAPKAGAGTPSRPRTAPPGYVPPRPTLAAPRPFPAPEALEPRRRQRLARERDPIDARLDLHGYARFEAQDRVTAFLLGAQARGYGAVLLITGQGRRGGTGVIRASIAEWLQSHALRGVVSGFSTAHRRHGGEGAIYVTLKRPRG